MQGRGEMGAAGFVGISLPWQAEMAGIHPVLSQRCVDAGPAAGHTYFALQK